LNEFYGKLEGKFKTDPDTIAEVRLRMESDFEKVKPKGKIPDLCRDRDDNNILHLAKTIHADFIITGDKDLLDLKFFKQTEIVSPGPFSKRFIEIQ
jgi:putative PIN family toxin of toxin-antitoxin system